MLLTIDIGNTNILFGVFKGETLLRNWRLSTAKEKTPDEYGITLLSLLENSNIPVNGISGAIISCVVPPLKETFSKAVSAYIGRNPLFVEPGIKTGMPISTDNPKEVGADRIVNAVGAYSIHGCELIVVDFGTAITFDYVTGKGEYAGGAISPGIMIASDALSERTAKLQRVEFSRPSSVVGKNTVDSIKSGLFYGFVGLVDGIVERIKKETGGRAKTIATGGYAGAIFKETRTIDYLDEFLVLKGLKKIYEVNKPDA
ncbi:MAG: type III pantothenate kinase [Deltaproteobacteria bacterium]|nr:type III pantothenate kinase [Deltaproteobacteria bacterium]